MDADRHRRSNTVTPSGTHFLYSLSPKIKLPTRTEVAPKLMAVSKSPLIPILKSKSDTGIPNDSANSIRHANNFSKHELSPGAPTIDNYIYITMI